MWSSAVSLASQPGSTTVVAFFSAMMAGPAITSPGRRSSRTTSAASCHWPPEYMRTVSRRGTSRTGCISLARLRRRVAGDHGLHGDRLDHHVLALHQEGKALAIGGLEARHDGLQVAEGHDQGRVATFVAHMDAMVDVHGRRR